MFARADNVISENVANPFHCAPAIQEIFGFAARAIFADHPKVIAVVAAAPITWNFVIKNECCPVPSDCSAAHLALAFPRSVP